MIFAALSLSIVMPRPALASRSLSLIGLGAAVSSRPAATSWASVTSRVTRCAASSSSIVTIGALPGAGVR